MVIPIDHPHLIVFGRYPVVGKTKTRLIPALGPAGAALLQKRLTEKTMDTAGQATLQMGARLVFCHDGGSERQLRQWLGERAFHFTPQASGDLGRRMHQAIEHAFASGAGRVVLVGTDIPGLTIAMVEQAFEALNKKDLVLGPSTDGGYWLVGMKRPENIFDGITWSTSDVLEKTLVLAGKHGMTAHLLDPLTDLDTPGDLAREMGFEKSPAPYLSVIIPTLNEERRIARTITAGVSLDAEIIVLDSGSKDRTVKIAESLGAGILEGEYGLASQQNRAAAAARGEVLLFLPADTRLPENYAGHIFETLMDRRIALGAFPLATDIGTPLRRCIAWLANFCLGRLRLPFGQHALFMRKRDLDAVGGLSDVPIGEDLHLVRLMASRGRITLAPAVAVTAGGRWRLATLINMIFSLGYLLGISSCRLARLCRWLTPNHNHEKTATHIKQKKTKTA